MKTGVGRRLEAIPILDGFVLLVGLNCSFLFCVTLKNKSQFLQLTFNRTGVYSSLRGEKNWWVECKERIVRFRQFKGLSKVIFYFMLLRNVDYLSPKHTLPGIAMCKVICWEKQKLRAEFISAKKSFTFFLFLWKRKFSWIWKNEQYLVLRKGRKRYTIG